MTPATRSWSGRRALVPALTLVALAAVSWWGYSLASALEQARASLGVVAVRAAAPPSTPPVTVEAADRASSTASRAESAALPAAPEPHARTGRQAIERPAEIVVDERPANSPQRWLDDVLAAQLLGDPAAAALLESDSVEGSDAEDGVAAR